jgi:hypothetical protein
VQESFHDFVVADSSEPAGEEVGVVVHNSEKPWYKQSIKKRYSIPVSSAVIIYGGGLIFKTILKNVEAGRLEPYPGLIPLSNLQVDATLNLIRTKKTSLKDEEILRTLYAPEGYLYSKNILKSTWLNKEADYNLKRTFKLYSTYSSLSQALSGESGPLVLDFTYFFIDNCLGIPPDVFFKKMLIVEYAYLEEHGADHSVFRDLESYIPSIQELSTEREKVQVVYNLLTEKIVASNYLVTYNINTALEFRQGACRHLSVILHYLLNELDIENYIVLTKTHAWVRVKLDSGETFDLDPMNIQSYFEIPLRQIDDRSILNFDS